MGWSDGFEGLNRMEPALRAALEQSAKRVTLPAGATVFAPGMSAENMILVLRGTVRVQHVSEGGRQIVLYRVQAGESCIMTTACLMAHETYSAEGVTETETEAALIPRGLFDRLVAESPVFRAVVFEAYARRMSDLFLLIDDVAFQRMDIRLAQKLLDLADCDGSVSITHQRLAEELGTAREVVSRQLQEFRRRNLVTVARGAIGLSNMAALRALAGSA